MLDLEVAAFDATNNKVLVPFKYEDTNEILGYYTYSFSAAAE